MNLPIINIPGVKADYEGDDFVMNTYSVKKVFEHNNHEYTIILTKGRFYITRRGDKVWQIYFSKLFIRDPGNIEFILKFFNK